MERKLTMLAARITIYLNLAVLAVGLIGGIIALRRNKNRLGDIHILVDGQYSAMSKRVDQLEAAFTRMGIRPPDKPTEET